MAIFDANKKMFLTVNVVLTDPDAVAAAKAAYPTGRNIAPYAADTRQISAATVYGAPFRGYSQPAAASAPFTWTPWSGQADPDGPYPLDVSRFSRHTGGFFGIGGTTVTYYWMAEFVLAADSDGNADDGSSTALEVQARRWVEGFELGGAGPVAADGGYVYSADAARHAGGYGYAFRGATTFQTANLNAIDAAVSSPRSWERFYFRTRQLGADTIIFWKTTSFPSAAVGWALGITAAGQIAVFTNSGGGNTLNQVIADPVLTPWTGLVTDDAWHRFDLLIDYTLGTLRIYVDGAFKASIAGTTATRHVSSQLGNISGTATNLEFDVDDWINATNPYDTALDFDGLNGKDWLNGSKVVLIRPSGLSTAHDAAAWPQEFRRLAQRTFRTTSVATPEAMVSTTSGAVMGVTTDAELALDADPGSIGVVAMIVSLLGFRGTTSGTLGYTVAGLAAVMSAITQSATISKQHALFSYGLGSGAGALAAALPTVTPIELRHTKGADVGSSSIYSLQAQVEMVGKWSVADYSADQLGTITNPTPISTGAHNRPYPRSPWAQTAAAAPIAPYVVVGGTYVGNGTGQDITFIAPPHWVMVRRVGSAGGYFWLSSGLGSHNNNQRQLQPQLCEFGEDPAYVAATGVEEGQVQQYRMRITGSNAGSNALGITYEYIAVCDPGMRFMLNLALAHKSAEPANVYKLINAAFAAGFAFNLVEATQTDSATAEFGKDTSGLAADALAGQNLAALTPALTIGTAGEITTGTALHALGAYQHALSLWRKDDGSADTGMAAAVAFGSYIGDGSASRTVNVTPASGKRPLYAIVFPSNSALAYQRDPSHTGSNSSSLGGADATTGITSGGIDQFSVGSALNVNAVTYTWFMLFAGTTAGNNGWGTNGVYTPVEPTGPSDGPWPPDPDPDATPTDPGGGTGGTPGPTPDPDDPSPDFGTECIAASTAIVNRALSRIGISKILGNVGTDNSIEAAVARTNWGLDVNQTLRDYHWPFATRYADLVLVAGTATVGANKDWQYSYRAPTDMIMARRIVGQAGQKREWDVDPIGFEVGSDDTGALIYTDAYITTGATTVQLEYTYRVSCPAARGDALFRSALTWRHASSLAASLSRDPEKVKFCIAMYERIIRDAETVAAQEQQQAKAGDADWITGRG